MAGNGQRRCKRQTTLHSRERSGGLRQILAQTPRWVNIAPPALRKLPFHHKLNPILVNLFKFGLLNRPRADAAPDLQGDVRLVYSTSQLREIQLLNSC